MPLIKLLVGRAPDEPLTTALPRLNAAWLATQPALGLCEFRSDLDELRMTIAKVLRHRQLFLRQLGDLLSKLLEERVPEDHTQFVQCARRPARRLELRIQRLFDDAFCLGLGEGRIQVRQLLHDDVLVILNGRERVALFDERLQRRFTLCETAPLLLETILQPVHGVAGVGRARRLRFLDVRPCQHVDGVHRQRRVSRLERHREQPAALSRFDAQTSEKRVNQPRCRDPVLRDVRRRVPTHVERFPQAAFDDRLSHE